jgi:hypothetical protein
MAEHSNNLGHHTEPQKTSILAKKSRSMECIIRDTIETEFHPYNINRDDDLSLSRSWKPLICKLKEWKQAVTKNMTTNGRPWKGPNSPLSILHPPPFPSEACLKTSCWPRISSFTVPERPIPFPQT